MRAMWLGLLPVLLVAGCGGSQESAGPWSPFGADLLFSSDRDGNSEIYLLRAGETDWINLSNDPAQDNWPEWSPDGRRIAFQSLRSGNLDVWVMNADGSGCVQLTDDPAHDYLPTWSPDGSRILFASWRELPGSPPVVHLFSMNPDGTDQRLLLDEPPGTSTAAMLAPDGSAILLSRKLDDRGAQVCLVRPDGSLIRQLTDDPAHDGAPAFSPDGSRIAYYADGGENSALWIVGADGSGPRLLRDQGRNWYPRWSPDGAWIVYCAEVGHDRGNLDIFAIESDGHGEPILLVGGPGRESEGRWRPAGGD